MSQYLGDISAYALAVSQGYTGTEEEYAELMASYADVGQTAVDAKDAALAAKTAAQTAATTATNKASEATTAATTATNKAAEAQADADAAALDASQALSAASTATTKATEATTAAATATSAKTDAVAANTAAQSAKTAAQTAQTGAETAAASVQSSAAQIATNTEDITQLKSELTDIVTTHQNYLQGANYYDGEYWKRSNPLDRSSASTYKAFYGIDVIANKTYYFKHIFLYYSVVVYEGTTSVITITDNTAQDASGTFTPTANGKIYISVNKTLSNPLFTDDEALYLSSSVDTYYTPNHLVLGLETTNKIADTIDGYYLGSDGNLSSASGYTTTEFIPINSDMLTLDFKGQTFVCFYDSSKVLIGSRSIIYFLNQHTTQLQIPSGSKFVRISGNIANVALMHLTEKPISGKYIFDVGVQKPYTSFTECIKDATKIMDAIVYVHSGTFDLMTEQGGSEHFDSYTYSANNVGIRLKNRVHIIGAGKSVLTFLYTGNNADVGKYYSPINALSDDADGFTLENITVKASNCRYCVHDDRGNDTDDYTNKYINCFFDLDNTANTNGYAQCLGGGLGVSGNIEVRNCIFKSRYVTQLPTNFVASYHNSSNANAQSRVVFDGNYCDGGTLRFSYYGSSTTKTEVLACNNSVESSIVKTAEGSATVNNINLLAWNNEIRSA